jgi:hypothetical protein
MSLVSGFWTTPHGTKKYRASPTISPVLQGSSSNVFPGKFLNDFLLCVEMFIAAVFHKKVFPVDPYVLVVVAVVVVVVVVVVAAAVVAVVVVVVAVAVVVVVVVVVVTSPLTILRFRRFMQVSEPAQPRLQTNWNDRERERKA